MANRFHPPINRIAYAAGRAIREFGPATAGYYAGRSAGRASAPSSAEAKGGAAPLPSKRPGAYQRRKKRYEKERKCNKLKGMALKKEVCKLSNQIKELKQSESASLGQMTYRGLVTGGILAADNVQAVKTLTVNSSSVVESVLSNLKYYDPSNPATLLTASAASGSYQKNFLVKSVYSKVCLRNNYLTDCKVTAYWCTPKADSSIHPTQAWDDGITTDAGNVASRTEINQYPTDYDIFRDLYTAKRVCNKVLSPGECTELMGAIDSFEYDPALQDEHSALYQKRFKAAFWLIVAHGTASHDSVVADEQGISASGLDYTQSDTWVIKYDAGVNLSYVMLASTLDTPTNGFVQSHQPKPNNIAYSVL